MSIKKIPSTRLEDKGELDFIGSLSPESRERAMEERGQRFLESVEPTYGSRYDELNYLKWKYE